MDMHNEAQDASRSEIRLDCKEELAKQLQAESAENHDLQQSKITITESSEEEEATHLDSALQNVKNRTCEQHKNGEVFLNGVRQDDVRSSKVVLNKSGSNNHNNGSGALLVDDANFEVSELIKEILCESSSFLEEGMNGVDTEYVDGITRDANNGISDHDDVMPLYFENAEGRSSSPDSDSNMRTASEGSSTPTSQLSAPSSHSSEPLDVQKEIFNNDAEKASGKEEVHSVDLENNLDKKAVLVDSSSELDEDHSDILNNALKSSRAASNFSPEKAQVDLEEYNQSTCTNDKVRHESYPDKSHFIEIANIECDTGENDFALNGQMEVIAAGNVNKHGADDSRKSAEGDGTLEASFSKVATIVDESKRKQQDEDMKSDTNIEVLEISSNSISNVTEAFENISLSGTEPVGRSAHLNQCLSLPVDSVKSDDAGGFDLKVSLTPEEMSEFHKAVGASEHVVALECKTSRQEEELNALNVTEQEAENSLDAHKENNAINSSTEHERKVDEKETDTGCSVTVQSAATVTAQNSEGSPQVEKTTDSGTAVTSDCMCKSRLSSVEDGGSVMVGVWGELRSSLRQLHRSMIPQSTQGSAHRSRPSLTRIKALANMLVTHDAHQLYLRISHLAHELCIELKVRLLATIHDSPTVEEASAFIQGVCDSYQWVMSVCEAVHPALERLDSEHLARFKLNWVTVNMHIFYATILTDPDVQDYAHMCKCKVSESGEGEDVLGCLASLHRTLAVAEAVWVRADALLQDYAVERAALTTRRRQLLADWEHFKSHHRTHHHHDRIVKTDLQNPSVSSAAGDEGGGQCPCDECVGGRGKASDPQSSSSSSRNIPTSADPCPPSSCECHYCNASTSTTAVEEPVLTVSSSSGSLPPLAQPQLSLYPHIHNTPPGSDIVGGGSQAREEMPPGPPPPSTKPPITANPYVGSDLLTEQLMREWEMMYGDALTPPGSHPILPPAESSLPCYEGNPSSLVSGVESLRLGSSPRPSYTRTMVDPALPYTVPDPRTTTHAHTTLLPSSSSGNTPPAHQTAKIQQPASTRSSTPSMAEGNVNGGQCCSGGNTTSVITHTRAHHTHTPHTGKCINEESRKHHVTRSERSTSRESESESSREGEEWSSGDESDSSTTVSSTHQDPHCDCCYCHMLHHNQSGGRQKYSDRRDRLLQILSRKKKARGSTTSSGGSTSANNNSSSRTSIPAAAAKGCTTPLGGQNIDDILDFIEGNHMDEAKHAKKAAKKARQKQKKMAIRREEEKNEDDRNTYNGKNNCDDDDDIDDDDDEVEEDGPLAELRRRAPDVTITVVRPGQQPPRTPPASQLSNQHSPEQPQNSMDRVKLPSAKLVPSLAQPSSEPSHQSRPGSRTILHPFRQANQQGRSTQPQTTRHTDQPSQLAPNTGLPNSTQESMGKPGPGGVSSLSNILKGMDTSTKEKDKGSQMVTIRRVMDPNNAEPTVTITLKGDQPEKDKVLFKLVNGQGNGGRSSQGSKKGVGGGGGGQSQVQFQAQPLPQHIPDPIPEGLTPEEVKKYKKRQKKERQRLRKQQEQMEEQQKGQLQQLELQKQQEFLRQQQEQIFQQQMALQRQQEELLKQQQQQSTQSKNSKKNKKGKKNTKGARNSATTSSSANKVCGNKTVSASSGVSAVVYDGDDMAQNFNLPPGVTINRVEGQPGMVTISNNMGGAFSQPFLPNPNMYPSPIMHGFPAAQETSLPKPYGRTHAASLSWNSTIDSAGNYPDKDVIVVDTNSGYVGASSGSNSSSAKRELTSDEKVMMAVKGLIDPSTLNMTQKKKFKKKKKELQEEKEKEEQKQREEDELMDQMYNLATGKITKQPASTVYVQNTKNQNKKVLKQKENSKQPAAQNSVSKQIATKNSKQQQKTQDSLLKQKHQEVSKQNVKNIKHSIKETIHNMGTHSGKILAPSNQNGKMKQQQQQNNRQSPQAQPPQQKENQKQIMQQRQQKILSQQQVKQNQQQKHPQSQQKIGNHGNQRHQLSQQKQNQIQSKQTHLQSQLKNTQKQEQQKQSQQLRQLQQQSQAQHKQQQQQQKQSHCQSERQVNRQNMSNSHKTNMKSGSTYGGKVNFVPQDIAHEARYAQYLAANADTLVKMNYHSHNSSVAGDQMPNQHAASDEDKKVPSKKKKAKKSRKGNLEDMTTIDSVFTPKDIAEGELDETERDVEAFKRFCFNNVPLHSGEKPKVNFNVKDIMIKKRPCNVNL